MRRAIIIASHYPADCGYPNDPHWTADAELLAARLMQHGYAVHRTSMNDALLDLREQVRQTQAGDSALVYFGGYLVLTKTGEPALLFGGHDTQTLGVRALVHRLATQLERALLVLDSRIGSEVEGAVKATAEVLEERILGASDEENVDVVLRLLPWNVTTSSDSLAVHDVVGELSLEPGTVTAFDLAAALAQANSGYRVAHRTSQQSFVLLPEREFGSKATLTMSPTISIVQRPLSDAGLLPEPTMPAPPKENAALTALPEMGLRAKAPPKRLSSPPPKPRQRRVSRPPPKPKSQPAEAVASLLAAPINDPIRPLVIQPVLAPPSRPEQTPPPPSWVESSPPSREKAFAEPQTEMELLEALAEAPSVAERPRRVQLLLAFLTKHPENDVSLERLKDELTAAEDWQPLASAYRRLIPEQTDAQRAQRLCLRLARLSLQHLDDPRGAAQSIERACELRPTDVELQLEAAGIYEERGDSRAAKAHYLEAIRIAPRDPAVLHRASAFFAWQKDSDRAWQAAAMLHFLFAANASEQALYARLDDGTLPRPMRALEPEDWMLGLLPGATDPAFTALLELVSETAMAWARPEREELLALRERVELEDVATSTTMLARSLAWTAKFLNLPVPALYLSQGAEPPAPLPTIHPSWMVGREASRGLTQAELAFLWARSLSRNSGAARVLRHFPDEASLEALLSACFIAVRLHPPRSSEKSATLALAVRQSLSPEERRSLEALISEVSFEQWQKRLHRFLDEVVYMSNRAGLLACGDPAAAARTLSKLGFPAHQLDEQVSDLFRFALSDEYRLLRQRLGLLPETPRAH